MKAVFVNGNMEQDIKQEIAQAVVGEDAPPEAEPPRRKTKLTERTAAKVAAFLLLLVMTAVTAGGILGALLLYDTGVYSTSETTFKHEMFSGIARGDGYTLASYVAWDSENLSYQIDREAAEWF